MELKYYLPVLIVLISVAFVSGCVQQGTGTLQGKITIGPLCPGPVQDPDRCKPTNETYKALQVAVFTTYKVRIAEIQPNLDGTYGIDLPTGNYIVDFAKEFDRLGGAALPANVVIKPGETTTLDIQINTGIL